MKFPDVTPAQIGVALGWVVTQLVSMGLIDSELSKTILGVGSSVIAVGFLIGDAVIRNGRAQIVSAAIESPNDTASELAKVKAKAKAKAKG